MMDATRLLELARQKMSSAEVTQPAVAAFLKSLQKVIAGETGMLAESAIEPVTALPRLDTVQAREDATLVKELAVIKLNGGLGTSMGLDRVKSLIAVKGGETFLDFIARQIFHLRAGRGLSEPAFYLMNSFSTRCDTLEYLQKYPGLADERGELDFLQSKAPKIDARSFEPVAWPENPELEWCPPGHGDLYPSMLGCGLLDRLTRSGVKYLFVSNSDNLGATVDLKLLRYFADSGLSFLMEVAERTASDRKGGHLARRRDSGRLLLRESAQCPKPDEAQFQDIERHRYFNTNNLWICLPDLKAELDRQGGALELPLIKNVKTVDPRQAGSPRVIQIESAMGAAIECFDRAGAILIPRRRFAPVKTTADLLALRSDAYRVTEDFCLVLDESRSGSPPLVELDACYRLLADFESCFPNGPPSLIGCRSLKVSGKVIFPAGVVCRGDVEFPNASPEPGVIAPGTYRDGQHRL